MGSLLLFFFVCKILKSKQVTVVDVIKFYEQKGRGINITLPDRIGHIVIVFDVSNRLLP